MLCMGVQRFANNRVALKFAEMKINLHEIGHEFEPKACIPTPGFGDLCFITETPVETVRKELLDKLKLKRPYL